MVEALLCFFKDFVTDKNFPDGSEVWLWSGRVWSFKKARWKQGRME